MVDCGSSKLVSRAVSELVLGEYCIVPWGVDHFNSATHDAHPRGDASGTSTGGVLSNFVRDRQMWCCIADRADELGSATCHETGG